MTREEREKILRALPIGSQVVLRMHNMDQPGVKVMDTDDFLYFEFTDIKGRDFTKGYLYDTFSCDAIEVGDLIAPDNLIKFSTQVDQEVAIWMRQTGPNATK